MNTNQSQNRNDKSSMMRHVQICFFALNDAALYLDGHPDDAAAVAYYEKYRQLAAKAKADYEEVFGPLSHASAIAGGRWTWIEQPWPWELNV